MFDSTNVRDLGYIAGFDAGCDYMVTEIERYIKRHDYEPRITGPLLNLLAHLKMEDRPDGTPSNKS